MNETDRQTDEEKDRRREQPRKDGVKGREWNIGRQTVKQNKRQKTEIDRQNQRTSNRITDRGTKQKNKKQKKNLQTTRGETERSQYEVKNPLDVNWIKPLTLPLQPRAN